MQSLLNSSDLMSRSTLTTIHQPAIARLLTDSFVYKFSLRIEIVYCVYDEKMHISLADAWF